MEPVCILLCLLKPATEPYTELMEYRPQSNNLFIYGGFNIILPSIPGGGGGGEQKRTCLNEERHAHC
jgi:hypothetical protein